MSDGATAGFIRTTPAGHHYVDWRVVTPESLFTTERLLAEIVRRRGLASGRMLDIGCGTKPYRRIFADQVTSHVGVDLPVSLHGLSAINAFSSATELPFRSGSFDFVLCTEVLEHVSDPWLAYREISRVLKPGGRALVTTPFMYRVHEPPYDFYRYTPFSHRVLAGRAGLEVEDLAPRGGYVSVLADLLLKGMALGVGALGVVLQRLFRVRRNIRTHPLTRWCFALLQRPLSFLLARERVKADIYTLGYVVVLRKPDAPDKQVDGRR